MVRAQDGAVNRVRLPLLLVEAFHTLVRVPEMLTSTYDHVCADAVPLAMAT